jgi:hypothetical protein
MTLKDRRRLNRIEFAGPDSAEVIEVLTRLESGPTHFSRGMIWWLTTGKMRPQAAPANVSWNPRPHPELPVLVLERSCRPAAEASRVAGGDPLRTALVNWITKQLTRI